MDAFLGKVRRLLAYYAAQLTQHTLNYAIRSGIALTATYAINQCSRLLKTVDGGVHREELMSLQERLELKIRIISPAIDLIELISARGNTTLESAVSLTKGIRWQIQSLGIRLSKAAAAEEISEKLSSKSTTKSGHELEIRAIVHEMRKLLLKIDDAVPLINLAITTSGAKLTTQLPPTVSPSRLLQASMFLTTGDHRFSLNSLQPTQIGPTFTLSLYMLFSAHEREAKRSSLHEDDMRQTTWKEVLHKAKVRIIRIPKSHHEHNNAELQQTNSNSPQNNSIPSETEASEFSYQIELIEDLDDDRIHTFEDGEEAPMPYKDVEAAGIREEIPVYQVSRIFYADTGKILNIGTDSESNNPVLLLRRDVNATPPRRMMDPSEQDTLFHDTFEVSAKEDPEAEQSDENDDDQNKIDNQLRSESVQLEPQGVDDDDKPWLRLPAALDAEWLAFEVYTEEEEEETEDSVSSGQDSAYASGRPSFLEETSVDDDLKEELGVLSIKETIGVQPAFVTSHRSLPRQTTAESPLPYGAIRSSLSLLEVLIRLTILQQFQQQSHLSIPDELLTFFLQESSTTGMDGEERRRVRRDATIKVGFDPYDESPIKRHGEDYQYQAQREQSNDNRSQYSRSGTPRDHSPLHGRQRFYERSQTPEHNPHLSPLPSREYTPEMSQRSGIRAKELPRNPRKIPDSGRSIDKLKRASRKPNENSPLGREMPRPKTDSTLGTSPATPNKVVKMKREESTD